MKSEIKQDVMGFDSRNMRRALRLAIDLLDGFEAYAQFVVDATDEPNSTQLQRSAEFGTAFGNALREICEMAEALKEGIKNES